MCGSNPRTYLTPRPPSRNSGPMKSKLLHSFATRHNAGRIVQYGRRIDMEVQGATFATWHPEQVLTGYSWDAMSAAALWHPSRAPRDVLLLGLAGGTMVRILRHFFPKVRITAVELDEELIQLGVEHMHLDTTDLILHIGDAYAYLDRTEHRFDVILDDVFLAGAADVYRPERVDNGIAVRYRRALKDDGIVAVNMITDKPHRPLLKKTAAALSSVFSRHIAITAPRGYNQALVAGTRLNQARQVRELKVSFPCASDERLWRRLQPD